ncbi:hypothetical protein SAMN04488583_6373 [Mycobacterium sp. 88mf]|nr:hypothetical protein SAMN04488583_6373 [Mycobacterium sp. 88mf]SFG61491.1 hypothetical protein SAMN04488582_11074 [Mycobacterium sp. 455mf]
MTVDTKARTDTTTTLAGSEAGKNVVRGESATDGALIDPGATGSQDGHPKRRGRGRNKPRLVWVCDRCLKVIAATPGAGFAAVDLRESTAAAYGELRGPAGPLKARWRVLHAKCAPECVKPLTPHFVVWTDEVQSVDDLLDMVATLSRYAWFAHTSWGASLVRRVLADTGACADASDDLRAQRERRAAQRRRERTAAGLPPGDPRHGTPNGYTNWGCKCDACKAANTQQRSGQRETK